MQNVIFHPRDKEGQLVISPKDRESECSSLEEYYRRVWERDGFPAWRIDRMWRELSEKIPAKSPLLQGREVES